MNDNLNFKEIVNVKSGTGNGVITHTQCKQYLRHNHPVLGVDWILDHDFEEGWIHAVRGISITSPVFAGHFEDAAMYPGTNLTQDINQVATLLFVAMTGELDDEVTAFKDIASCYGHPIPPGCVLDFAVWAKDRGQNKTMEVHCEGRIRDFPFYEKPNKYGLTFKSAITNRSTIVRAHRSIYDGIWF